MMNKQKTSKAWRWKVATFLPLLALLLMAFGNRSEKVPPEESIFAPISTEVSQDSIKVWSESDFKVFTKENKEEAFFKNHVLVNFQIDAKSKITVDGDSLSLAEVSSYVKKWFNYNYAEQREWIHFQKITVNGKTQMLPMSVVTVRKDPAANQSDFLKLLNVVANTVLQIRGDYSQDIYGNLYQKITPAQRKEIDKLIPMKVAVTHAVMISSMIVPPPPRPQIMIQIRKDGNYMDNKLCSLEEIGKKVELLYQKNPNGVASLKVESDVPMVRVTEVKEVLRNSKVLHINYSVAKSDVSKPSTLPPPPPPSVKDLGFRITIIKDALRVNSKACTFNEIEKMLNDINPQKQFIQIDTHSTSSKELQSSLKEMLEKKDISYQILWSK